MRLLFLPFLLALSACATQAANGGTPSTDAGSLRFSGQVQAIDNCCFADAVC